MDKKASQTSRKGFAMPQTKKSLNLIKKKYWQSFVSEEDFFFVPTPSNKIYGEMSRMLKGSVKPQSIYGAAKYHQEKIKAHVEKVLGRKLKFLPTSNVNRRKPHTIALLSLISSDYKYWSQFRSVFPSRSDKIYEDLQNDPAIKEHNLSLNQIIDCVRRYKKIIKKFPNPKVEDSEMETEEEVAANLSSDSSSIDEDAEMKDESGSEVRALRSMSSEK